VAFTWLEHSSHFAHVDTPRQIAAMVVALASG